MISKDCRASLRKHISNCKPLLYYRGIGRKTFGGWIWEGSALNLVLFSYSLGFLTVQNSIEPVKPPKYAHAFGRLVESNWETESETKGKQAH